MAANDKLKLAITTELDNQGIKATENQINGLANKISKVNKADGLSNLQNALGDLPGPIGKIGKAIGGLAGQVTAIIGAFKIGFDIGTWLNEKFVAPLLGIKDPIDQLKKQNKKLRDEFANTQHKFNMSVDDSATAFANQQQAIKDEISTIQKLGEQWNKASKAKLEYSLAGQDSQIQKLERERFEDIMALESTGASQEEIDQANKLYDVFRKQYEAKKQVLELQNQQKTSEKEIQSLMAKQQKQVSDVNLKFARIGQLEKEMDEALDMTRSGKEFDITERKYQKQIHQAKRDYRQALDLEQNIGHEIQTKQMDLETMRKKWISLASGIQLDIEKTAYEYDKFASANGNPLGLSFSDELRDDLNAQTNNSYKNLLESIDDNTGNLGSMLSELLTIKGG